jgi:hypothetical protein
MASDRLCLLALACMGRRPAADDDFAPFRLRGAAEEHFFVALQERIRFDYYYNDPEGIHRLLPATERLGRDITG